MVNRLQPDKVREIALELMDANPWDFDGPEDISYLKTTMYNIGVKDMATCIIKAIEELEKL